MKAKKRRPKNPTRAAALKYLKDMRRAASVYCVNIVYPDFTLREFNRTTIELLEKIVKAK